MTFIELAQSRGDVALICIGFILLVLLALYLFDFFSPPHLPGRYLRFCTGPDAVGTGLLFSIGTAGFLACVFSATFIPSLPLLATTFLSPVGVILIHQALISEETVENMSMEELAAMDFKERIRLLREITDRELRQSDFCVAAAGALALAGLGCLCVWVPWAMRNEPLQSAARDESELLFVLWVAPLVVGLSNLVFALFVSLRVALNNRYKATHTFKNRLIVSNVLSASQEEIESNRELLLKARNSFSRSMSVRLSPMQVEKYLTQHVSCLWLLSAIMKAIGCAFAVMIGAVFATFQLVTAVGPTTSLMVQSFTSAFFVTFVSFVAVCFGRLWQAMSDWMVDFPAWRFLLSMTKTAWARAAFVLLVLPFSPLLLALSALNQCVRRWRGLEADAAPERSSERLEEGAAPRRSAGKRSLLTRRVRGLLEEADAWDWVAIVWWWYVLAWGLIVIKLTPLLLNVLLAWMSSVLGGLHFGVILAATFALGMVLFMLPPVPGPPIYLFGGVVISDACPLGFWWGAAICVALSFALKLTACAVQQKLIGERLGESLRVRRTAGVHTPLIRAIEMVLRTPGLSFDKCMILCGGPDWPTSVLAGILRLPLHQCLIGTVPVLLSLVPLCLTGSFYVKRDQGQLWVRAGNLMFALTALVSVGFWAGMGWAIQDVYDKCQEELKEPREEFLELEWLDYRADYIAERLRLRWAEMPLSVWAPFIGGALCLTSVCHAVLWRSSLCFGSFKVTGDMSGLSWFGDSGLLRPVGAVALALMLAGSGGFVVHGLWDRRRCLDLAAKAAQEIDILEELWKEQKMDQARELAHVEAWEKAFAGEVTKCLAVPPDHGRPSSEPRCGGGGGHAEPPSPTRWLSGASRQAQILGRPLSLSLSSALGMAVVEKEQLPQSGAEVGKGRGVPSGETE